MGARLQGDFYSDNGEKFTLTLYDSNYSGAIRDFELSKFSLKYKSINGNIFEPILTSELSATIRVSDSIVATFIQNTIQAAEGRFVAEIKDSSGNKEWIGYLLTDLARQEDKGLPYYYEIVATDGIARLKKLDFNDGGTSYSGRVRFLDAFYLILDKIGLSSFYDASDTYFETVINWWENSQTVQASTSPLYYSRFDHKSLISVDSKGNNKYMSTLAVLEMLCEMWGCRFLMSGGTYKLIQVNENASSEDVIIRHFKTDKSFTTTTTAAFAAWGAQYDDEFLIIQGGSFEYLPPLKRVSVFYKHLTARNIMGWRELSHLPGQSFIIEDIDSNGGLAKFGFSASLRVQVDWTIPANFEASWLKFKIRFAIQEGATVYYLRRNAFINGSTFSYELPFWTTASSYVEYYIPVLSNGQDFFATISFITPEIPIDGDLTFDFFFDSAVNLNGVSTTSYFTPDAYLNNTYLEIIPTGSTEDQYDITEFYYINNNTGNSEIYETELLLGDGPQSNSWGKIEITDDDATWEDSAAWRRETTAGGDYLDRCKLLASEILRVQGAAVEVFHGTIDTKSGKKYRAHNWLLRRTDRRYIFGGGTWDLKRNEIRGEWYYIGEDETVVEQTPILYDNTRPTQGPGGPLIDGDLPSRPSRPRPTPNLPDFSPTHGLTVVSGTTIPARTDTNISDGDSVTSIPIIATTEENVFRDGQTIILTNPITGQQQEFTVDGDVASGATSISVVSDTADNDFPVGTFVQADPEELAAAVSAANYGFTIEPFDNHQSTTITVTKTMPATNTRGNVWVFQEGQKLTETAQYGFSGQDIQVNSNTHWDGANYEVYIWG